MYPGDMERIRPYRVSWLNALAVACLAGFLASAAGAGKIGSRYDRNADYGNLETYSWRLNENKAEGSPLAPGGEIDTLIRGVVAAELERRGYREADGDEAADFEIAYDASREIEVDNLGLRRDIAPGVAWVVEGEYRSWERGTLVLSIYLDEEERAAWSAWTTEKLKEPNRPSRRQLERATRKMLSRFPPR